MEAKRRKKVEAVLLFVIVLLFWISTISHHTLGFVAPVNGETIGFDIWTGFMWFLFLFAARNLYRQFRAGK